MSMTGAALAFEQAKAQANLAAAGRAPAAEPKPRYITIVVEMTFKTDFEGALEDYTEAADFPLAIAIEGDLLRKRFGELVCINPIDEYERTGDPC